MIRLLKILAILGWVALTPRLVMASNKLCADLVRSDTGQSNFWMSDEPILVNINGSEVPLTLSFDSEVPLDDIFKQFPSHPELEKVFTDSNLPQSRIYPENIQKFTGFSKRQVEAFVLKKGTALGQQSYSLSELRLGYVPLLIWGKRSMEPLGLKTPFKTSYQEMIKGFAKYFDDFFKDQGLKISAGLDLNDVELRHSSYSSIPKEFKSLLDYIKKVFPGSSSHLHMGLPSELGEEKTLFLARVAEAIVVLSLSEHKYLRSKLSHFLGTTFAPNSTDHSGWRKRADLRGVVRLGLSEWKDPRPMSNLEVRQYEGLNHGLEILKFISELAQKHDQLDLSNQIEFPVPIIDPSVGNITGALWFIASFLKKSSDPEMLSLADKMNDLAGELDDEMKAYARAQWDFNTLFDSVAIPEWSREKLSAFLIKNEIRSLVMSDIFTAGALDSKGSWPPSARAKRSAKDKKESATSDPTTPQVETDPSNISSQQPQRESLVQKLKRFINQYW